MTRPSLHVEGARQLKAALRKVEDGISDLKSVHGESAKIVEVKATALAPRLSGTLAGSTRSSGTQAGGVVRSGGPRIPWALPIHFGWPAHNIAPNPFVYDALDDRRQQVIDVYDDRVKELIRKNNL